MNPFLRVCVHAIALLYLVVPVVGQDASQIPTADQVIDNYIEALGGEVHVAELAKGNIKVTGRHTETEGETEGVELDTVTVYSNGRLWSQMDSRHDMNDTHQTWSDGKTTWFQRHVGDRTPFARKANPDAPGYDPHRALNFRGHEFEVAADELDGQQVWRLTAGAQDWLFSKESELLVGLRSRLARARVRLCTIEHRKFKNVLWPAIVICKNGRWRREIVVTGLEIDADISGVKFRPDE